MILNPVALKTAQHNKTQDNADADAEAQMHIRAGQI